jgi:hypothetical protein
MWDESPRDISRRESSSASSWEEDDDGGGEEEEWGDERLGIAYLDDGVHV